MALVPQIPCHDLRSPAPPGRLQPVPTNPPPRRSSGLLQLVPGRPLQAPGARNGRARKWRKLPPCAAGQGPRAAARLTVGRRAELRPASEASVFTLRNVSAGRPPSSAPLKPSPPKEQPPSSPRSHRAHALASPRTGVRPPSRAPGPAGCLPRCGVRMCGGEGPASPGGARRPGRRFPLFRRPGCRADRAGVLGGPAPFLRW